MSDVACAFVNTYSQLQRSQTSVCTLAFKSVAIRSSSGQHLCEPHFKAKYMHVLEVSICSFNLWILEILQEFYGRSMVWRVM